MEMYNDLKVRWNAIWQEPEMTDAWRRVEARKEEDAKEKVIIWYVVERFYRLQARMCHQLDKTIRHE